MNDATRITTANPSCLVFLIDQSASMEDPFGERSDASTMEGTKPRRKADAVADAVNKVLQNLALRCKKKDAIGDYYYISVIGYGEQVGPAFVSDALKGKDLVPISEVAHHPDHTEDRDQDFEDGVGGIVTRKTKIPIWFGPKWANGTPMYEAMSQAENIVSTWLKAHPECFPPIILNITDGEYSSADPSDVAKRIRGDDLEDDNQKNVLLFNVHLSSHRSVPVEFPDREDLLPDEYAKFLFRISSVLPPVMREAAQRQGYRVSDNSRGFMFNADAVSVIKFLNIGTVPENMLR